MARGWCHQKFARGLETFCELEAQDRELGALLQAHRLLCSQALWWSRKHCVFVAASTFRHCN